MPGRCAAPPAPAMITSIPRSSAPLANSAIHTGVRWAETMCFSCATPKRSRIAAACCIVSQSDDEPMTTATRDLEVSGIWKLEMLPTKGINHEEHEGHEENL